jgi:hypothetical protein
VCARLHHVFWPLILAVNVATIVAFLISCLLALSGVVGMALSALGVVTQMWKLTAFATIPTLYFIGLMLALAVGDRLVRRVVDAPPPPRGLKIIAAAAIAVASASYAILAAPFARSIEWRGITYDIAGRDRIHLRSYRPYHAAASAPSRSIV